jgi:catechol 2,3-dioxygenase-like lactoylglutathione lyase family enzyme
MADVPFVAIDHVQLAMPPGGEQTARLFYATALGMVEIPKPTELAKRGGGLFESGGIQVHLGVDNDFHPARKAHPALRCRDYDGLTARLQRAGIHVIAADDIPGVTRCHVYDPFGNRIELIRE